MRVLVTNDDGVHAPGLGALARSLARWRRAAPAGEARDVVVVAPLHNHSGASAAVGTVYERESVAYHAVRLEGAADVPAFGVDASPALAVIVSALGAFGPPPDVVVSGINHGVNVGRSILHSGTVGAVLTGSQFKMSGLAVSMRSGAPSLPWGAAADLAVALLPALSSAPVPTLWNLNVPHLPLGQLRGVRWGHIGPAGVVRSARDPEHPEMDVGVGGVEVGGAGTAGAGGAGAGPDLVRGGPSGAMAAGEEGALQLQLGAAVPFLGDVGGEDPVDDAALVAAGFASVTPLRSVQEDREAGAGRGAGRGAGSLGPALGPALADLEKLLARE